MDLGTSLPATVDVVGELPIEQTYRLIAGAKALILPALWAEPFGRVVIEAFALGTPVISSSTGGLPELIMNERSGLLVAPGDAHALAGAIDRLASDPGLAATLRRHARAAYEASFSEQANHDRLIAIYERALAIAGGREG
jgi:glycosyltransferase involved in cell wall biosynthesis